MRGRVYRHCLTTSTEGPTARCVLAAAARSCREDHGKRRPESTPTTRHRYVPSLYDRLSPQTNRGLGVLPYLVAIFHSSFHPTKGNVVDWCLKASDGKRCRPLPEFALKCIAVDLQLDGVEFSTLPSGLHLVDRDVVYVFPKRCHPLYSQKSPSVTSRRIVTRASVSFAAGALPNTGNGDFDFPHWASCS